MIETCYEKAVRGEQLSSEELEQLSKEPLDALCRAADKLRKEICGTGFDLCTITNGKSGRCSEDCKYCAQAVCYTTSIEEYPLIPKEQIAKEAAYNWKKGVLRFSVVTSGKQLTDEEIDQLCRAYKAASQDTEISLCASHGLLSENQFVKLKEACVSRYHNNLETSRNFFPKICTTHSYEDKIETIRLAQKAGLEVCSGGIIGLGESMRDRIDMVLELRQLGIKSVPVNILNPIPGTPLEKQPRLSSEEVCRTIALFRFALPNAAIRLAGGRGLLEDKGRRAFCSGANAAICGDMLTTAGISIDTDLAMLHDLGFKVVKENE